MAQGLVVLLLLCVGFVSLSQQQQCENFGDNQLILDSIIGHVQQQNATQMGSYMLAPLTQLLGAKEAPEGMIRRVDFVKEKELARFLLDSEEPFIFYNVPELDQLSERWTEEYLLSKINNQAGQFLKTQFGSSQEKVKGNTFPVLVSSELPWINEELRNFAVPSESLFSFRDEPQTTREINLRVVQPHEVSSAHYDHPRTFIGIARGGSRRYVISPPSECKNLYIQTHNCAENRHSLMDWSQPDLKEFPNFSKGLGLSFDLNEGEVLFMPSFWTHYIVSGDQQSIQVMVRAGFGKQGVLDVSTCRNDPELLQVYLEAQKTVATSAVFQPTLSCEPHAGGCNTTQLCFLVNDPCFKPTSPLCPKCGNKKVDAGEQCDPGRKNFVPTDCCTNHCRFKRGGARCGLPLSATDLECYKQNVCDGKGVCRNPVKRGACRNKEKAGAKGGKGPKG